MSHKYTYTFNDGVVVLSNKPLEELSYVIKPCETYWGSHGCHLGATHIGYCECDCCPCEDHLTEHEDNGCVAKPPYYGSDTKFY